MFQRPHPLYALLGILFILFVIVFLVVAIEGNYLDVVQTLRFEQPTEFLDAIFVQVNHDCPGYK
jgi:hypothetical protein